MEDLGLNSWGQPYTDVYVRRYYIKNAMFVTAEGSGTVFTVWDRATSRLVYASASQEDAERWCRRSNRKNEEHLADDVKVVDIHGNEI